MSLKVEEELRCNGLSLLLADIVFFFFFLEQLREDGKSTCLQNKTAFLSLVCNVVDQE